VFSVDPTNAPIDWLNSGHMICVSCDACPFCSYISKSDRSHSRQLQVVAAAAEACEQASKQAVSLKSTEVYKKSVCEDLTCDMKILCVIWCSGIGSV
jgi:ssDNA-binding Zn-finger/Zn-ribbon topoisomerase 1